MTIWKYVQANFDKLNATLPSAREVPFATRLPDAVSGFCDSAHADEVEAFFQPRLEALSGGSRSLAWSVVGIRLYAAKAEVSRNALSAFLRP